MPTDYTQIIDSMITDLDKIEQELLVRIENFLKSGATDIELSQLDAELDIFQTLNDLGYEGKIQEFMNNYDQIVLNIHAEATKRGLNGIVGVTARDLEIIANNNEIFLLDKGRLYGSQFKSALLTSLISGQSIDETLNILKGTPLTDSQLYAEISQGLTRFESLSIGEVYKENPEQRFELFGPEDAVTRASCHAVLLNQPKEGWTRQEIDDGLATKTALKFMGDYEHSPSELKRIQLEGYTWIDRGGYGCRHMFYPK